MLLDKSVVGDVWLYNQSDTPLETDWTKKEEMPFLNPIEYVNNDTAMHPIISKDEVKIECDFLGKGCSLDRVKIYVRGILMAVMKSGSKSGWAKNAKKDGPLAKMLMND